MNEPMKPVREETQRERALFAAALRTEGTALTQQAELEISVELLGARKEADALAVDNERLRKLIKSVEMEGHYGCDSDDACPWCGAQRNERHIDCPAFDNDSVAPEGEVR